MRLNTVRSECDRRWHAAQFPSCDFRSGQFRRNSLRQLGLPAFIFRNACRQPDRDGWDRRRQPLVLLARPRRSLPPNAGENTDGNGGGILYNIASTPTGIAYIAPTGITNSFINSSASMVIDDPVGFCFASLPSAAANGSRIFLSTVLRVHRRALPAAPALRRSVRTARGSASSLSGQIRAPRW
jgi:hypothetical protein